MRKDELRAMSLDDLQAEAGRLYREREHLKAEERKVAKVIAEVMADADAERLEQDAAEDGAE